MAQEGAAKHAMKMGCGDHARRAARHAMNMAWTANAVATMVARLVSSAPISIVRGASHENFGPSRIRRTFLRHPHRQRLSAGFRAVRSFAAGADGLPGRCRQILRRAR